MAVDTGPREHGSAIAGLDSLELAQGQAGGTSARIARKLWSGSWPKLLAIAIVLAAWQLFYASNFRGDTADHLVKSPAFTLGDLWDQALHGSLWGAISVTLETAVVGYAPAVLVGSLVGAVVSRILPLRAAVG